MKIKTREEFKNLIPPLSVSEYQHLEKSILSEGCRDPLCLWNGVIVDGHNRYEICTKHGIRYNIRSIPFNSVDEAKHWIVRNQFSRRNISVFDKCLLALEMESIFRAQAKQNQATSTGGKNPRLLQEKVKGAPVNTRMELSKLAGVSPETLRKVKKIRDSAGRKYMDLIRTNQLSINYAYYKINTDEKRKLARQQFAELEPTKNDKIQLYHGDIFEVAKSFDPNSIDCIITDPLWGKTNVESCGKLARVRLLVNAISMALTSSTIFDVSILRFTCLFLSTDNHT